MELSSLTVSKLKSFIIFDFSIFPKYRLLEYLKIERVLVDLLGYQRLWGLLVNRWCNTPRNDISDRTYLSKNISNPLSNWCKLGLIGSSNTSTWPHRDRRRSKKVQIPFARFSIAQNEKYIGKSVRTNP